MELKLYWKLSTRSRRALARRHYRGSQKHAPTEVAVYTPRGALLERLSQETGMTQAEVVAQLFREREYLMSLEEKV